MIQQLVLTVKDMAENRRFLNCRSANGEVPIVFIPFAIIVGPCT